MCSGRGPWKQLAISSREILWAMTWVFGFILRSKRSSWRVISRKGEDRTGGKPVGGRVKAGRLAQRWWPFAVIGGGSLACGCEGSSEHGENSQTGEGQDSLVIGWDLCRAAWTPQEAG